MDGRTMTPGALNVCSFWVHRPEQFPDAADYAGMLKILQRSCDAVGVRHVVLTDFMTAPMIPAGIETFARHLPGLLMHDVTEIQATWIERGEWAGGDTLFVGADCILRKHPNSVFPMEPDLCVTLRPSHKKYPINTGAQMIRTGKRHEVAAIYREIATNCGPKWCDDQRAIEKALSPMPALHGVYKRRGLRVAFLPMAVFNDVPRSIEDERADACVLHFRGKHRKGLIFEWAERWGFS